MKLLAHMAVTVVVSDTRIQLAVAAYREQIARFAEYLKSEDPDHYKRCRGAALRALYKPDHRWVETEYSAEQVETGFSRVEHAASEKVAQMLEFYSAFHNEFVAFELCFKFV